MIRGAREAIVYRPNYSGTIQNNPLFRGAVDTKGFIIGTPGVDVIDVPRRNLKDLIVDHARGSAFFGSDLLTCL